MRPISVAVLHRDVPAFTEPNRMYGEFSYPVPEFNWRFYPTGKFAVVDKDKLAERHDVIYYEDVKLWCSFTGTAAIPVCYRVHDSALSETHYRLRHEQAAKVADLILVDWDRLDRFADLGAPVRRYNYAVNDSLFRDLGLERRVDVGFYCHLRDAPRRVELDRWLWEWCLEQGYTYESGTRTKQEYVRAFARTKVVVHFNRTPATRSTRVFDVMAARTCLLAEPQPEIEGDYFVPGKHFAVFQPGGLYAKLDWLLTSGEWERFGREGYDLIHARHTWAIRAKQLREMFVEAFPKLGERP